MNKKILIFGSIFVVLMIASIIFLPKKNTNNRPVQSNPSPPTANLTPDLKQGPIVASMEANLSEKNNSGSSGIVTFNEVNGKVFIGVDLNNTTDKASHPAYVYEGSCEKPENAKYSLSPVVNGKTANYITGTLADFKKQFPLAVRVHKSAQDLKTDIVCADLK